MAPGHKLDCGVVTETSNDIREKKPLISSRKGIAKPVGHRRIFAPQFKLQVLDSYRQDADCRGNQRATARKYGIHRRQIQKWLQVEASLRTTVEVSPSANEVTALNLSAEAARLLDDTQRAVCQQEDSEPRQNCETTVLVEAHTKETKSIVHKEVRVSLFPTVKIEVTEREEEIKDSDTSEDDLDEDILSSDPEHPLDFTCATLSKRRSFSLQFKLDVLDAFRSDETCKGNQRATARKFGINRRQIQKWLGQESELRDEAASSGGLFRQRLGRLAEQEELSLVKENAPTPPLLEPKPTHVQHINSDECGWDLSIKKRKIDTTNEFQSDSKRQLTEYEVSDFRESWQDNFSIKENTDVQNDALCLVKDRPTLDNYNMCVANDCSSSIDNYNYAERTTFCCPEPISMDSYGEQMHEEYNVYYSKVDPTYQPVVLPVYHVPSCCIAPRHAVTFCSSATEDCKSSRLSYPLDFTVNCYLRESPLLEHSQHYSSYKWYRQDAMYQGSCPSTPVINMYQ